MVRELMGRQAMTRWHIVARGSLLVALLASSGCATAQDRPLYSEVQTTGPVSVVVRDAQQRMLGVPDPAAGTGVDGIPDANYHVAQELDWQTFAMPKGQYTAEFTVVDDGPVTIRVSTVREGTSALVGPDDSLLSRALFVVSEPIGAVLHGSFATDDAPDKLELAIDREGDGVIDAYLNPEVASTRHRDSDPVPTRATADVMVLSRTEAQVTLLAPHLDDHADVTGIAYSVFPSQPRAQRYTEPFLVTSGSLVLFVAYDQDGLVEATQEVKVLGGVAPDIHMPIEIDGPPVRVVFSAPGQEALLTFHGTSGHSVRVVLSDVTFGILACNRATINHAYDTNPAGTERTLFLSGDDDEHTITIDPRCAATGALTVQLIDERSQ